MDDEPDKPTTAPESLLPYAQWQEAAMRQLVRQALSHVASQGLPGEHHFYITFRTDQPGVAIPDRLRAQYPTEMTIVLQHQYWDMSVADDTLAVGLSFGNVPSMLRIPLAAIVGLADPHVGFNLRLPAPEAATPPAAPPEPPADSAVPDATPQVVSLDAFRRRKE